MKRYESRLAQDIMSEYRNREKYKLKQFRKEKCIKCKNQFRELCKALKKENEKYTCENYEEIDEIV